MRPAVAGDGGDITFRGFKDGVVYLNMKGSCAGCPSSTATLKHGIQNLLLHFLPDVREVEAVWGRVGAAAQPASCPDKTDFRHNLAIMSGRGSNPPVRRRLFCFAW